MAVYAETSKAVYAVFHDTAPLVEGLSIDEAFLDVRGMERIAGSPREIAQRLRRDVREQVGLPITVGWPGRSSWPRSRAVSPNPTGCSLPADRELAFLHPLPIERLWGVGPVTAAKLHERGSRPSLRWRGWERPLS